MKILTITLHSSQNSGSALQAFALQNFLESKGYDTQIIDYRPKYVSAGKNKLRVMVGKVLFFPYYISRTLKFSSFVKTYMKLTNKRYRKYKQLADNPPNANIYITGSDQLWNYSYECGRDDAFYLKFVKNGRKMSYAVSIGRENVPESEIKWISNNVSDFDFVSVREKTSQALLQNNGVLNVSHVCDPTLLVNEKEYRKMTPNVDYGKYVAVYLVNKSDLLDDLVVNLKDRFGYKIIQLGGFSKKCKCDIHLKDMGPCEFLGLIANAEFVIASSFHATIFSHIFKKKFAVLLPESNATRMEQFLEITNLNDRNIKDKSDIENTLKEIDYDVVSLKLAAFVEKSKRELINAIENLALKRDE